MITLLEYLHRSRVKNLADEPLLKVPTFVGEKKERETFSSISN